MAVFKGRRLIAVGAITPPQTPQLINIQVVLKSGYNNPKSEFCYLKHNKKAAFVMCKDDGFDADYTQGYAYLQGGIIASDGVTYPGVTFTDGAGKTINYKMTFAINTTDPRTGEGPYAFLASWAQYRTAIAHGFDLANHSAQHTGHDKLYQVKQAEKVIFTETGFRTRTFVVPTNDEGYANTAPNLGYLMVGSSFGTPARDDFEGANDANGVYGVYWGGQLNAQTAQFSKGILFNRWYSGEGQPGDWNGIKDLINKVFTDAKVAGNSPVGHWFSHGINDAGEQTFELWKEVIQMIKNHPDNNDSVWIPGQNEFVEYFETKKTVKKTEVIGGGVMNIELDLSLISGRNQLRDMSLLVTGGVIDTISVEGADSFTVNKVTGLINIYKRNLQVTNPAEDLLPAQIISLNRNGTGVQITYDKPVSQSAFSNSRGPAYTVTGNTVLSVTGSGTTWVVNCQNQVVVGSKLSYRMQRGNATDINGLKVCTYIEYPID